MLQTWDHLKQELKKWNHVGLGFFLGFFYVAVTINRNQTEALTTFKANATPDTCRDYAVVGFCWVFFALLLLKLNIELKL